MRVSTRGALIALMMAPVAVLLGACPPIPTVWMFNATASEVVMVLVDEEGTKQARLPPGRGKSLTHQSLGGGELHVRAGRCDYAYDMGPIERTPGWGQFYMTRLEPDFRLKALVPSQENSRGPLRGDLPAFETEAITVRPTRKCA